MPKNNLIRCPKCELTGSSHVLGEVTPTGEVIIQHHYTSTTKISGSDFTISCGDCNEPIFHHNERRQLNATSPNQRDVGIYWFESQQEIISVGLGSSSTSPGTTI